MVRHLPRMKIKITQQKQWKLDNPEKVKESARKYRIKNIDKIKAYYKKNSNKIRTRERERYYTKRQEISVKRKLFYKDNRDSILRNNIIKKYKLTNEAYDYLIEKQNGKCAICLEETKLCVDHCHKTGKVRGLLCGHCNKALGFIKEDIELLDSIKNYLK